MKNSICLLFIISFLHSNLFSQYNWNLKYDENTRQAITGLNKTPLPNYVIYYNGTHPYRNTVKEMGNMVNGMKTGEWIMLYQTSILDDNVSIKEKGKYVSNEKDGEWLTYYDGHESQENSTMEKINYSNGKKVGEYIKYSRYGQTQVRGNYNSDGQEDGDWLTYEQRNGENFLNEKKKYSNGKLIYKAKFVNDEFIEMPLTE